MAIIFLARWFPLPERRDEFVKLLGKLGAAFTPELTAAIDSIRPTFNRDGQFVAIEVWNNEETLNSLRASKLFHDAIRAMSACCNRPAEIEHFSVLGEESDIFERYPVGKADPKYYPDLGAMTPLYR
jgi:quinol monooxygenase YgiN